MPTKYIVNANSLNVREEPDITARIVGFLNRNEEVQSSAASSDGRWLKIAGPNKMQGWASSAYLHPAASTPTPTPGNFPWWPLAQGELGVKEVDGSGSNPRVLQYLRSTDLDEDLASTDETAWCSAFVNWCIEEAGYQGTNSAWARSWLNWGRRIETPVPGCITVFTRDGGGHVAFFVSKTGSQIKVLGGNQSNTVNQQNYPASRLLGYRLPG